MDERLRERSIVDSQVARRMCPSSDTSKRQRLAIPNRGCSLVECRHGMSQSIGDRARAVMATPDVKTVTAAAGAARIVACSDGVWDCCCRAVRDSQISDRRKRQAYASSPRKRQYGYRHG